jgi:hypothetical protein
MQHPEAFTGKERSSFMEIVPQRAVARLSPAARANRVVRVPSRHEFAEAAAAAWALDSVAPEAKKPPAAAHFGEKVLGGGEHYAQRPA